MSAPAITTDSVLDAIKQGHDTWGDLIRYFKSWDDRSVSDYLEVEIISLMDSYQIHCIDGVYYTDKHEALKALQESCES